MLSLLAKGKGTRIAYRIAWMNTDFRFRICCELFIMIN